MNMIYNSPHYCVVEFSDFGDAAVHAAGGYEILDKGMCREIFLRGADAVQFRSSVQALIANEPSPDDIDAFLEGYAGLMTQTVALH